VDLPSFLPVIGAIPSGLTPFSPSAWGSAIGPLRPLVYITIDGAPVSGAFSSRIIQASVSLKAGGQADTIDLELYAGPEMPGGPLLAVPRRKAIIEAWMGYAETGVEYKGHYTVDTTDLDCLPYRMKITGKSASMRSGLKQHRNREWGDGTADMAFGPIAQQIAGEVGLTAQVSGRIGQITDRYWSQQNESGLHFLQRHAERFNGTFAVKGNKLIIADRDEGETPGGSALGVLVITPPQVVRNTLNVRWAERDSHKKVRARYRDRDSQAEDVEEEDVGDDGDADAVYTLRHPYASREEAKRAAAAKAQSLRREADSTSVTILGTPYVEGGQPMIYEDIHPDVDGTDFIIDVAQLSFSKRMGFRAGIQAKASTKGGGGKGKHKGPKIVGARPNSSMSRGRGN
jgi:phage protein D